MAAAWHSPATLASDCALFWQLSGAPSTVPASYEKKLGRAETVLGAPIQSFGEHPFHGVVPWVGGIARKAGAFVLTTGTSTPTSSSDKTVMAMRRFRARPSGVELSAIGRNSP